jgi:hypothetical protein
MGVGQVTKGGSPTRGLGDRHEVGVFRSDFSNRFEPPTLRALHPVMFRGEGIVVFPLMLLYTAIRYTVFKGKVQPTTGHY